MEKELDYTVGEFEIIRNNEAIKLTAEELRKAYDAQKKNYTCEDIASLLEEKIENGTLNSDFHVTEIDIVAIAEKFLHNLEKCDSYFEAYWESLDLTLAESQTVL